MKLGLTPDMAAGAYEYLRVSKPYRRWKLPEADDLGFRITRHNDRFGHFRGEALPGKIRDIAISESKVITNQMLVEVMAHEMIHLYQEIRGTGSNRVQHNAEFKRLARSICRTHGFDPKTF